MAVASANLISPVLSGLFFLAWSILMSSFLRFNFWVAPRALERWAVDRKLKVFRKKHAGPFRRIGHGVSNVQVVYEVDVRDGSGKSRPGVVTIGSYWWPSWKVESCPIEVRWLGPAVPDDWSG